MAGCEVGLNLSSCSPITPALNKTNLKEASSSLETPKDETEFHFDIDVKLFPNTQLLFQPTNNDLLLVPRYPVV
ncbi:hypothetical protein AV530_019784 [Patagioenas fasciata monilis]|uniref:Uncharacterized protein n=1 Tax=Patagioenas fasciata monilis TaxID=372326 RepID=A0A1V4JZJ9_PATFA|nr:hypothetical protein AV530_019784 [Patagioenas fasciata monilis]